MPFRDAHEVVGKIVRRAIEVGRDLEKISLEELREFSSLIENDVYEALSLEQTLNAKSQIGGTARERVDEALLRARRAL
jgi:argininosuccinate lyase